MNNLRSRDTRKVGCILKEYAYSGIFLCVCARIRIVFMESVPIGCSLMECRLMKCRLMEYRLMETRYTGVA